LFNGGEGKTGRDSGLLFHEFLNYFNNTMRILPNLRFYFVRYGVPDPYGLLPMHKNKKYEQFIRQSVCISKSFITFAGDKNER
jgi:hypothetical protein